MSQKTQSDSKNDSKPLNLRTVLSSKGFRSEILASPEDFYGLSVLTVNRQSFNENIQFLIGLHGFRLAIKANFIVFSSFLKSQSWFRKLRFEAFMAKSEQIPVSSLKI